MQLVVALERFAGGVLALTALETPRPQAPEAAFDASHAESGRAQEDGATAAPPAPELAEPAVLARLLDQHAVAKRSKDAAQWLASLERMAAFANPEFVEPALESLKYRATRDDKAAAKLEAEELGDVGKERIQALVLRRESEVQAAGARVLALHSDPAIGQALLDAFQQKNFCTDKPLAAAACVDAMGRGGYRDAQEVVLVELKRQGDKDVLKACVRYFGQVKTTSFDAVRVLCEELAAPVPADVDSAFNPPASYWEERWRKWQYVRRDLSWSLREITGQTFQPAESDGPGDSRRALDYVKEKRRELGLK